MGRYKKRKDGRYYTSIMDGYRPDGKPNRIPIYGKTIKELEAKRAEVKYEITHKIRVKSSDMTLEEYSKGWMNTYKSKRATGTKNMYMYALLHINREMGHLKINDIKKSDIQMTVNEHWEHYRVCQNIVLTMKQILNSAMEDKLIYENVCKGIELPEAPPSNKRALYDYEEKAVFKADFSLREQAFVYIIFFTGLRRSEALALTKSDIDFNSNTIRVNEALVFNENGGERKGPKSNNGYRDVPLVSTLKDFLRFYINTLSTDHLFTKMDGSQITKSSYDKMWRQIINKMELAVNEEITDLTAHIFRHNYCTILYYSGISENKAIELMGHADSKMIREIYTHLSEKKENVHERLEIAFKHDCKMTATA